MRTALLRGLLVVLCLSALPDGAWARGPRDARDGVVAATELPREARDTLALIAAGGPFPYDRDGVVFGNRERSLPERPRGYYHEYTVKTPGVRSRGARRIVCGGSPGSTRDCYYSDDHYQTFRRIR
jgi:ribonuclease T1